MLLLVSHSDHKRWSWFVGQDFGKVKLQVDFGGLKLKVIGAIVAISAIDLLKTFVEIPDEPTAGNTESYFWKVTFHMAFVLSGVIFAWMDRISAETKRH
ncbi:MAG: hypothetical protein IIB46_02780 [Nitrospinae bacterium]|nr:hypothetical protein [Nitrospinota bacterium]